MPTRRAFLQTAAALSAAHSLRAFAPANPIVKTTNGPIRGLTVANGIACFKGIPYGLDTAQTRFAPPKPPTPWAAPRDCFTWGPKASQVPGARPRARGEDARAAETTRPGYHLPPDEGPESEDCLHLNLWTPGLDHKHRPVMLYIHGGAYSNGTVNAQLYDGARLARRGDVVVVTVNHRLNSFGYLYLPPSLAPGFEDSGNAGQLDLVLALQWVRDNIASFGGDPSRVLIFGQSGGGAKCATLMAQPPAHGLFHRVISMSGQQVTGATPDHAADRTRLVLKALNLDTATPDARRKALLTLPWQTIQRATPAANYYGPVTDGRSLPVDPFSPTDPKLSTSVPMLLGNMHDETRGLMGQPVFYHLTWDTLPEALEKNAPFLRSPQISLPVPEVIAHYRHWHPDYTAVDVFFAVTTDSRSWRGQVIEAERRAADPAAQPHTWVYQLNWKTPVTFPGTDIRVGSPHTLDIPLAFDNVALSPGMVGSTPDQQATAQQMADIVSETYIAFARTGRPDNPHIPPVPTYSLDKRSTLIFDIPPHIEDNPRGRERTYLGQVPYTQPGT